MNLDFNDPDQLIDDQTSFPIEAPQKASTHLKDLNLKISRGVRQVLDIPDVNSQNILNPFVNFDEEKGVTIEAFIRGRYPNEAKKLFDKANQARAQVIHCQKTNGSDRLWCGDWATPDRDDHPNGKKERDKYLTAAKYLPDLLQENGEIIVGDNRRKRFANFRKGYRFQNLWIEYYLLGDLTVLTELGFERPSEAQYRSGKIAARIHNLVQDIWAKAVRNENPLCRWILNYDSPDQVWFALEAIQIVEQWNKIPQSSHQFYQSEQIRIKCLEPHKGKKYLQEEVKNDLSLDEAFNFTILRLLELGKELPHYRDYLQARVGQANAALKKKKIKSPEKGFASLGGR